MTLQIGTRLGPYEILTPLGAGGMGEVYKARDTKLRRDVAIKVLPDGLAKDPDALARFEREAHAVAALNHPNILSIHDFGNEGGVAFAVMELLEGDTLREIVAAGVPPQRKAVEWGRQIAAGLAAAHGKGIVHRDLKPDNVFVTHDGRVKILDFGLAKPTFSARSGDQSRSPTVSAYTEPGTVMGTVGYMSPEQAKGIDVDHRSDIFSLGSVLFEMLTGRRAFQRETAAETMTAILREEPPELAESGRKIPPGLDRIVRHCLEKKPDQRFQSASDVAFALEETSGSASTATAPAVAGKVGPRRALAALGLVAAGVVAGAVGRGWLSRPAPVEPIHMRPLTFSGRDRDPSASSDGKLLAFTSWRDGISRIWIKQLSGGGEAPLTAGPDRRPRFSPDGTSVLFVRDLGSTQALYRVGILGGEPRKLAEDAWEADWSPDGKRIVYFQPRVLTPGRVSTRFGIFDVETGKDSRLADVDDLVAMSLRWSPDGSRIAFAGGDINRNIATWRLLQIDPSSGTISPLGPDVRRNPVGGIGWSGGGQALFFVQADSVVGDLTGSGSRVVRLDVASKRMTPILWADGLAWVNASIGDLSRTDVLAPGRLVFGQQLHRQELREIGLAATNGDRLRILTQGSSIDRQPAYSPDGKLIVFSSNRSGNLDLWTLERSTGVVRQITDDRANDWDPAFTPDGKHILWDTDRSGKLEVWMSNADGTGARQVTHDGADAENPTATPSGNWIVYWSGNPSKHGVWRIHPDGSGEARLSEDDGVATDVSPDGRYAMYVSMDRINLHDTLRVVEIDTGKKVPFEIPVTFRLASESIIWGRARWSPDGKKIYFIGENRAGLSGVFVQDFEPGRDTTATRREVAGFSAEYLTESLGMSPDGSLLTISTGQAFSTIVAADNVPGAEPPVRKAQ